MFHSKLSWLFMVSALFLFVLLSALPGCGGGSSGGSGGGGGGGTISVAVTASATTVDGAGTNTVTLTATVTNDKNAAGVTWSVSGGGTLSGQTTTSATYTPPAASSSALTVTITATSIADSTKSGAATITVPAMPALMSTNANLVGSVGAMYSVTLQASGGIAPYTWVLGSGTTLPACLTLESTGVLTTTSGTAPTASCAGTYTNITFKITDSGTPTPLTMTSSAMTITITAAPAITFTGSVPATGTYNVTYSGSAAATGGAGALTYSVSGGALPPDLSLNTSTGAITGTPSKAADVGTFNFTIKAADAYGDSNTQSYQIVVSYSTLTITTATTLPVGYGGTAYSQTLAASGGSGAGYTWTVTSGTSQLTAVGLSLSSAGVLSGTTPAAGSASFGVKVTDSASDTATATFSVTINPGLSITTTSPLPSGYGGTAYSQSLAATGGSGTGYSWTVTSGGSQLTAVGLSLSSAGVLSGSSPVASSASFGVKVTDSASNTATAIFSVTINAGLTITTASTLPVGYAGVAYSQPFASSGGTGTGLTWTVISGGSQLTAVGLSLSSAGVLSGSSPVAGTAGFSVKVTDSASNSATGTFSVTINSALTITSPATLPAGYVGSAYSQTLTTSGGSGTGLSWTVTAGSSELTAIGLSLSSAGVLSGSSPTAGSATFSVKVTDSVSNTATGTFSVTIGTGLTITNGNPLPAGFSGTAYTDTLTTAGGSGTGLSWTVTSGGSQLTAVGLSLSSAGVLSGSSPVVGSATFGVKVTDSASNSATASFSVTINAGLTITTSTPLPTGYAGTAYTDTLTTSGGSGTGLSWTVTAGGSQLTAIGLSLSSAGVLSGSSPLAGTASFGVKVTDSASNTATGTFSVTINAALTITTTSPLPNGLAGTAYSQTLMTSGGSGTGLTWTVTSGASQLTAVGLSLSSAGALSGSSPTAGSASFGVKVTDSASNTATGTFSVTINAAPAITSANSTTFTVGAAGTFTVTTTGTPTPSITELGTLPSGVTFVDNGNGSATLSGTPGPGTGGICSITINAHNGAGSDATQSFTLTVDQAPAITSASSASDYVGEAGTFTVTATGFPTPSISEAPALPSNVTFKDNGNGTATLSGTPTAAQVGTFTLTFTASNGVGTNATQNFTLTIMMPPLSISPSLGTLPNATLDSPYTEALTASGGVSPYTFSLDSTSAALPAGLSLSSSGVISGTPTATGTTNNIVVDLKDSESPAKEVQGTYSINVVSAACGTGNEAALTGQYAFLLQASNSVTAGSFQANGTGGITGGEMDFNGLGATYANSTISASSTYSVGSDNRGCLTLVTTGGTTIKFRFALSSANSPATNGSMIEFDGAGLMGGPLRLQTPSAFNNASLKGHYTFRMTGMETASPYNYNTTSAGFMQLDGSGNISAGAYDWMASYGGEAEAVYNDAALSGTYGSIDTNGRGTIVQTSVQGTSHEAIYVVNASDMFMITTDPTSADPVQSGEAVLASGPLTLTSGSAVNFNEARSLIPGTASDFYPEATLFLYSFSPTDANDGTVSASGMGSRGECNAPTPPYYLPCIPYGGVLPYVWSGQPFSYTIDSNGRVTVPDANLVMYLSGPNQGIVVFGWWGTPSSGVLLSQTATALNLSRFFLQQDFAVQPAGDWVVGAGTVTSPGQTSITEDEDEPESGGGGLFPNQTSTGTYSFGSNGTGSVGSGTFAIVVSATEYVYIYAAVDPAVRIVQQ